MEKLWEENIQRNREKILGKYKKIFKTFWVMFEGNSKQLFGISNVFFEKLCTIICEKFEERWENVEKIWKKVLKKQRFSEIFQ